MDRAVEEALFMEKYDYIVINDDLDRCVEELHGIVNTVHQEAARNEEKIETMKKEHWESVARIYQEGILTNKATFQNRKEKYEENKVKQENLIKELKMLDVKLSEASRTVKANTRLNDILENNFIFNKKKKDKVINELILKLFI